ASRRWWAACRAASCCSTCARCSRSRRRRSFRRSGRRLATMSEALVAGFPVLVEQAVVWGDMDSYRHVNNVVYFRYFENARLEYFRRLDWFALEAATGVGPILHST